jgi:aspartokinase-like uncharacterized kinase
MTSRTWFIKVGGSLLTLSNLGPRLRRWLDRTAPPRAVLLMGGGPTADVIRCLDAQHGLGEERAHWLALRALALNGHALAELLPGGVLATDAGGCAAAWERGQTPILDPLPLLYADEGHAQALPHRWDVTSDSVAARLAELLEAETLVLLKSCDAPPYSSAAEWARLGIVDRYFPQAADRLREVRLVNLRAEA